MPSDRHKCTNGHYTKARNAIKSSFLLSTRTLISPDLASRSCVVQRELMDGLHTPRLLRGRLDVDAVKKPPTTT